MYINITIIYINTQGVVVVIVIICCCCCGDDRHTVHDSSTGVDVVYYY